MLEEQKSLLLAQQKEALNPEELNFSFNPKIAEGVNKLNQQSSIFSFPGVLDPSFHAVDYAMLFNHLALRLNDLSLSLKVLHLTPCTLEALQGLSAFCQDSASPLGIEKIIIDIAESSTAADHLAQFKLLLTQLSTKNLVELEFSDPKAILQESDWQNLAYFIQEQGISIQINLPKAYLGTALEKDIDTYVSINQRLKNQALLAPKQENPEAKSAKAALKLPKRQRPTFNKEAALGVDIELAQEQQVEIALEVAAAKPSSKKIDSGNAIEALSLASLESALGSGSLCLKNGADLISNHELKKCWYTWLGQVACVERYNNPKQLDFLTTEPQEVKDTNIKTFPGAVKTISKAAAEELLNHRRLFNYGLNFTPQYLPAGFILIKEPKSQNSFMLHYDPSLTTEEHPLAPLAKERAEKKCLAADVFAELIAGLNPQDPAHRLILTEWKAIDEAPAYDRATVRAFQRHLPHLLSLNVKQLEDLFTLAKIEGQLDAQRLDYILTNYSAIEEVFHGQSHLTREWKSGRIIDNKNPIAWNSLCRFFAKGDAEDSSQIQALIRLAHNLAASNPNPAPNPLWFLLKDKAPLKKRAQDWAHRLHFDEGQLQALLQVYSECGEAGLNKLFDDWDALAPEILTLLISSLFKKAASFTPMLQDETLKQALKTLAGLKQNPAYFAWWSCLLKQHAEVVGYDDLATLVTAFTTFRDKIENDYKLAFYQPIGFSGVKSLPTTLARILTILAETKPEDRAAQWAVITSLSLQANGAIRAFTPPQGGEALRCGFVLPIMDVRPENYDANLAYTVDDDWQKIALHQDLPSCRKHFYAYLARQKHRLPLDFYQEMDGQIHCLRKPTEKQKICLFAILADSSCGLVNTELAKDLKGAKEAWMAILDTLEHLDQRLPLGMGMLEGEIRLNVVYCLAGLKHPPALPILKKLTDLLVTTIKIETWNPFGELKEKGQKLVRICENLDLMTRRYGDAIYTGMRFYDQKTYEEKGESIFYRHLDTALALAELKYSTPEHVACLLALISTFRLAAKDRKINLSQAEELITLYKQAWKTNGPSLLIALQLFQSMDKNAKPPLEAANLSNFLQQLIQLPLSKNTKDIQDRVKADFEPYFPQGFFQRLQATGLPEEVTTQLNQAGLSQEENQGLRDFLLGFHQAGDAFYYFPMLQHLLALTENLNKDERHLALEKLRDPSLLQACSAKEFSVFLASLRENESLTDFMFFMNKVSQSKQKDMRGLLIKANLYLNAILPSLQTLKSEVVGKMDTINLVIDLLLATEPEEFESQPAIERSDAFFYARLNKALETAKDSKESLKELQAIIDDFMAKVPEAARNTELSSLKGHIDSLLEEKPEMAPSLPVQLPITKSEPEKKAQPRLVNRSLSPTNEKPLPKKASGFGGWLTQAFSAAKDAVTTLTNTLEGVLAEEPKSKTQASLPLAASKQEIIPPAMAKAVKPLQPLNKDLLAKTSKEIKAVIEQRQKYAQVFTDLFLCINQIAEHYAGDKDILIPYLRYFLSHKSKPEAQIVLAWEIIHRFKEEFIALNQADLVRSLCSHFNQSKGDYTPQGLYELLSDEIYVSLDLAEKQFFLHLLTALSNNAKPCKLADLKALMRSIKEDPEGGIILKALKGSYAVAPYPSLEQFLSWKESCPLDANLAQHFAKKHQEFDKEPCERELDCGNGFDLSHAKAQRNKLEGIELSDEDLENLEVQIVAVRDFSTTEIIAELKTFRQNNQNAEPSLSNQRLLALAAELLYRTKGMPAETDALGQRVMGRSFEINTTQYLALYAMLSSGKHVSSEIGTGEGKSRIMMVRTLCEYVRGQTVDFVTTDIQLAIRDYLSYSAFFHAVGASTNLIYQYTPASDYQLEGINFSDTANLNLFRNKARSQGQGHLVITSDPQKRALLLDEADKPFFDLADTRQNYSELADPSICNMPWVYGLLIDFFTEETADKIALYQGDMDACNQAFMNYVQSREFGAERIKRLACVSIEQIEAWQQAALTALQLEFEKDFTIKAEVEIATPTGPKLVSEAHLVAGGRADPRSKFSFGVHQCLHARLNKLKNQSHSPFALATNQALQQRIADCAHNFFIDDEKQIIYSSNSKSMIDEYKEGVLCTVTGTPGSNQEKMEAQSFYGDNDDDKLVFIQVPRHKGLNRIDYPLYLARDKEAEYALIVKQIKEAMALNEPVLIFCEDDRASAALLNYLNAKIPEKKSQLLRIEAGTNKDEEADLINKKVGQAGMITLSTAMIGRGTDIPLHGQAKEHGIRLLVNYLPTERDLLQIIARAGRFGAKGSARVILNKVDLKQALGKKTLNEGFYTATEAYIKRQHALMDHKAQVERLTKYAVADFRRKLINQYFDDFFTQPLSEVQRQKALQVWRSFFAETDKKWLETWPLIQAKLSPLDFAAIDELLKSYQKDTQAKWTALRVALEQEIEAEKVNILTENLNLLALSEKSKELMQAPDLDRIAPLKTAVYDSYDPAHDGKAVLYTRWFEKIRAVFRGEREFFADFKAWRENRGILFPNLRAWWQGHMSLGQLLLGGATKESPIIQIKPDTTMQKVEKKLEESSKIMLKAMGVKAAKKEGEQVEAMQKPSVGASAPLFQPVKGMSVSDKTLSSNLSLQ